ncbi:outer membrane protein [Candidatus Nitrospira salsa]|nr:MAG: hypothetical protein NPIRA01_12530 [Nitrospirales bacterium]
MMCDAIRSRSKGWRGESSILLSKVLPVVTMAVVLFSFPQPAAAWLLDDVDKGFLSIGGHATYYDPLDAGDEWYGGAHVRAHILPTLAIEGLVDYRDNDFGNNDVVTIPVQASALFYLLPGKRFSPFVLGGAGWYYTDVDSPTDDDTDHRFGLHAGGGVQLMLNERWSVDGTYRYVWVEDVKAQDVNFSNKDFEDDGHMVTIGLNLHF